MKLNKIDKTRLGTELTVSLFKSTLSISDVMALVTRATSPSSRVSLLDRMELIAWGVTGLLFWNTIQHNTQINILVRLSAQKEGTTGCQCLVKVDFDISILLVKCECHRGGVAGFNQQRLLSNGKKIIMIT